MKCDYCQKELSGKQKRFCSPSCKSGFYNKNKDPEKREWELERHKIWRNKNKELISSIKKRYYESNKEKLKSIRREYHKLHPETDWRYKRTDKGRYLIYKRGAKTRGLVFELLLEDFPRFRETDCVYCGDSFDDIGIDRIDNNIGYTKENTVSCCPMCNKMKHAYSQKDFLDQCKKIVNNIFN